LIDYVVLVTLGYVAYQAACERLFGVKVILVEIFVGLMGASLAVMPFFIDYSWQQAFLIVLFVLFCAFWLFTDQERDQGISREGTVGKYSGR